MNSSLCVWLAEIEEALWRMIRGAFHFTFLRLPNWIYRTLLDTVGPAVVRLIRVLAVFCLWLAIVVGPALIAGKYDWPRGMCLATLAWLVLALAGSIWGRAYLARRRRAALHEQSSAERSLVRS